MKNQVVCILIGLMGLIFAVCIASMIFFTLTRQISIPESVLSELLSTTIILAATLILYSACYLHRPTSTFKKTIVALIALAILLPSLYLCLTEFAVQTINFFKWGSIAILAYIISAQLTTNNATSKSQNPTHNP